MLSAEHRSAVSLGRGPVGWLLAPAVLQAKTVLLVACPFRIFSAAVLRVSLPKARPAWLAREKGFAVPRCPAGTFHSSALPL